MRRWLGRRGAGEALRLVINDALGRVGARADGYLATRVYRRRRRWWVCLEWCGGWVYVDASGDGFFRGSVELELSVAPPILGGMRGGGLFSRAQTWEEAGAADRPRPFSGPYAYWWTGDALTALTRLAVLPDGTTSAAFLAAFPDFRCRRLFVTSERADKLEPQTYDTYDEDTRSTWARHTLEARRLIQGEPTIVHTLLAEQDCTPVGDGWAVCKSERHPPHGARIEGVLVGALLEREQFASRLST